MKKPNWLQKLCGLWSKNEYPTLERVSFIREEGDNDPPPEKLSLLDIKAAIAEQNIPVSELFSRQDLSANRDVIGLVHDAETKARTVLEKEIVVLKKTTGDLQAFKDKADVSGLVEKCKLLADKDPATVKYIRNRMKSGRGVQFDGGMTEAERQERVNDAIAEEFKLIESEGIVFKKVAEDGAPDVDDFNEDPNNTEDLDMSSADNNSLIPGATKP